MFLVALDDVPLLLLLLLSVAKHLLFHLETVVLLLLLQLLLLLVLLKDLLVKCVPHFNLLSPFFVFWVLSSVLFGLRHIDLLSLC